MWNSNFGDQFPSKADAFKWLNEATINPDMPKLRFNQEQRYTKTPFGIFDEMAQAYVKGKLPVEYYESQYSM